MVTASDKDILKMSLPLLRSGEVRSEDNGWLSIGRWKFSLERKEFVVTIETDRVFEEYSGDILSDGDIGWKAVITQTTRS